MSNLEIRSKYGPKDEEELARWEDEGGKVLVTPFQSQERVVVDSAFGQENPAKNEGTAD